jgi:hypothetical protein
MLRRDCIAATQKTDEKQEYAGKAPNRASAIQG